MITAQGDLAAKPNGSAYSKNDTYKILLSLLAGGYCVYLSYSWWLFNLINKDGGSPKSMLLMALLCILFLLGFVFVLFAMSKIQTIWLRTFIIVAWCAAYGLLSLGLMLRFTMYNPTVYTAENFLRYPGAESWELSRSDGMFPDAGSASYVSFTVKNVNRQQIIDFYATELAKKNWTVTSTSHTTYGSLALEQRLTGRSAFFGITSTAEEKFRDEFGGEMKYTEIPDPQDYNVSVSIR